MKPRLLFSDEGLNPLEPSTQSVDLVRDRGLTPILDAMAADDPYLRDVAVRVLLADPLTPEQVVYRQEVLDDCLAQPDAIREVYALAGTAIDAKRRVHAWIPTNHPGAILRSSVAILRDQVDYLARLHAFAAQYREQFHSPGLTTLLDTIGRELDEAYLAQVRGYIHQLEFTGGVVLTARLGPGCTGVDYALREAASTPWWTRLGDIRPNHHGYTYHLPPRDENGGRTMERIQDHGINTVADAAAQSSEHVLDFFRRLTFEVGFYLGCVHLHQALDRSGVPTCRPTVEPRASRALTCRGLVDAGLGLRTGRPPVGSDLDADTPTCSRAGPAHARRRTVRDRRQLPSQPLGGGVHPLPA
ncbi:MAG: hypothetical protein L0H79_12385 [Intrasporangium sp.]|uniref:hypothetical protein n=1 Tax=Intrasporangium sp. TaxID=1925024 RepID=UPI0026477B3F|nr:hypothetical protein [Intrasporangium sp.]MDN5796537.1 hypothetical protein [Intrasporangium sp.]